MPAVPIPSQGRRHHRMGHRPARTRCSPTTTSPRRLDTSDEWIVERTGIRERRVGGTTSSLSIESGRQALEMAGLDPPQIDALVLATTTPDRTVPATSPSVQHELGLRCGAFDVNAACSGFVYGLVVAHGLIAHGRRAGPRDRHRHAVADHRLGRPQHGACCSPTAPARS